MKRRNFFTGLIGLAVAGTVSKVFGRGEQSGTPFNREVYLPNQPLFASTGASLQRTRNPETITGMYREGDSLVLTSFSRATDRYGNPRTIWHNRELVYDGVDERGQPRYRTGFARMSIK